jgi:hypothetical protein
MSKKAVIQAGWDDAPWLDLEAMAELEKDTPPHLREARRRGTPTIGAGSIYQIPLDSIVVDDFPIPNHYKRLYAIDVGWNNTAILHGALNPDDDCLYAYSEYKQGESRPEVHAHYIKGMGSWIPGVIDPAARGRSQIDGMSLFNLYRQAGLNVVPANNEVESGITAVYQRLSAGKLKIFRSLRMTQREYVTYARDLNGKIIKKNDHLMDGMRYIVNNIQRAVPPPVSTATGATGARKYF